MAAKPAILNSPRSVDEVFAAVLQVVQAESYALGGLSNEQKMLLFRSGKSAVSWGHQYVVGVVAFDDGGSQVQLTTDGVPGAPRALLDGRKNSKAGQKLVDAVQAVLDSGATPSPQPVESFATLEDGSTVPWTSGDYPGA